MKVFRVRFVGRGAHVHARVFVADDPRGTFAKIGDLIMTHDDWNAFLQSVGPRWQFVHEGRDEAHT